jgi:hypothetical protein
MNGIKTAALLFGIALVGLFTTACPERRTIADIEANPGRYQNKEVAVAGRVVDSYGVAIPGTRMGGGAFKIDDGTGSMWILVADGAAVPQKGTQLGVYGTIGSSVTVKGRNYGLAMYEKGRRYPKR